MREYPAIRAYLDELAKALAARSPECHRMLTEAEDHLLDAAAQMRTEGMPPDEAERAAAGRFGTPSEVAARWATGRDFAPDRKTRWRSTALPVTAALLLMVAAILFVGVRGPGERMAAVAPPGGAAKAFTAVKVETLYNESGEIRLAITRTEVFRSDGSSYSTSRSRNGGQTEWPPLLQLTSISDPTKRVTAMLLPGQGLVSSLPLPAPRKWSTPSPRMCSYLLDALDRDPNSGRAEILGYEVRQHTFGPEGTQEVWVAPDLDCYEMRVTNWHADRATGKRYAALVSEVVFVAEGEPPVEYFDMPAGFRECPPSEILRSVRKAMDHRTAENNSQFYQRADEQYYRVRNGYGPAGEER